MKKAVGFLGLLIILPNLILYISGYGVLLNKKNIYSFVHENDMIVDSRISPSDKKIISTDCLYWNGIGKVNRLGLNNNCDYFTLIHR